MKDSEKQRIFSDGYVKAMTMAQNIDRRHYRAFLSYVNSLDKYCTDSHQCLMILTAIKVAKDTMRSK